MSRVFDITKPIYLQIMEHIKISLANGNYAPGDKVPSVRDLALEFEVNPNTVQKALTELEREGLLRSERTSGRFVTDDEKRITTLKKDITEALVKEFVFSMKEYGINADDIVKYVNDYLGKDEK